MFLLGRFSNYIKHLIIRHDEDMYRLVVNNYEEKQKVQHTTLSVVGVKSKFIVKKL